MMMTPGAKNMQDGTEKKDLIHFFSLPLLICNKSGLILRLNHAAENLLGKLTAGADHLRSVFSFSHQEELNSLLKSEPGKRIVISIEKNGSVLKLEAFVAGGNSEETFIALENCSGAAGILKSSYAFRQAERLTGIGYWEWNLLENRVVWSDELCRIVGKSTDTSDTHRLLIEYVHPDDKHIALESLENAYKAEASHVHVFRIVCAHDVVKKIETITEVERNEQGRVVLLYGTARDLSLRDDSAEKLREVDLMKLLNASAAAANLSESFDEAAAVCLQNICEFTGWQIGQLYHVSTENTLVPASVRFIEPSLGVKVQTEFSKLFDLDKCTGLAERVKSEKRMLWAEDITKNENAFTILNAKKYGFRSAFAFHIQLKNEVIGILEFFSTRKIKEDPRLQQVVSHVSTHLARMEERRRSREELKIAKERAEISEKAKEQFLANISHEIRTPLNGILGFTNLLSDTELNAQQRKYLNTVKHSTDNLLDIVNNVLDLSKIETGKITFEETSVEIRNVVSNAVNTIKPRAKSKKLPVTVHVQKDVPAVVLGDSFRLGQVLLNLLSNAVKFTAKGKVDVLVKKMQETDSSVTLYFSVTDTGIGIKKEKLSFIFESFTQASSDITRKYGGTGLGLTIAKQIVELQNGTISVESEFGKGSVFSFSLTFKKANVTGRKSSPSKSGNSKQVAMKFSKVLVVEDNPLNRQLMRRLLEDRGMEVHTATNGKVAVKKVQQQQFDLILMDLQMPVMDGFEAARKIRMDINTNVPIIAVTAHAHRGENEKCREAGMNDYLSKPIDRNELFGKIDQYIYSGPKTGETAATAVNAGTEIDLSSLTSMMKGNRTLIKEMALIFIKNTPSVLKKFDSCLESDNFTALKLYAHKLRSSVKILGMERCDEMLKNVEVSIDENKFEKTVLSVTLKEVKRSCLLAIEELKKEFSIE